MEEWGGRGEERGREGRRKRSGDGERGEERWREGEMKGEGEEREGERKKVKRRKRDVE